MPARISILRLVWTDFLAYLAVIYPAFSWASFAFFSLLASLGGWRGQADGTMAVNARFFLYASLLLTLLGAPLLVSRILTFRSIQRRGVQLPGQIVAVRFYRDRGQVDCTYDFQERTYRLKFTLHRNARTLALRPLDPVQLVVDPNNPQRAFIGDLFLEEESG